MVLSASSEANSKLSARCLIRYLCRNSSLVAKMLFPLLAWSVVLDLDRGNRKDMELNPVEWGSVLQTAELVCRTKFPNVTILQEFGFALSSFSGKCALRRRRNVDRLQTPIQRVAKLLPSLAGQQRVGTYLSCEAKQEYSLGTVAACG